MEGIDKPQLEILDLLPNATLITDERGFVVYASPKLLGLAKTKREDMVFRPATDFLLADRDSRGKVDFGRLKHAGLEESEFELWLKRVDGHFIPVHVSIRSVVLESKQFTFISVHDTSNLHDREQRLTRSYKETLLAKELMLAAEEEPTLDGLAERIMDSFLFLLDSEAVRFYTYDEQQNKLNLKLQRVDSGLLSRVEKMTRTSSDRSVPEILPGSVFERAIKDHEVVIMTDHGEIEDYIGAHSSSKLVKRLSSWIAELFKVRSVVILPLVYDSKVFGLVSMAVPTVIGEGESNSIYRLWLQVNSILKRHRSEQELMAANYKWNSLINNSEDLILTMNPDLTINTVNNPHNIKQLGTSESVDLCGKNFLEVLGEHNRNHVELRLAQVMETGEFQRFEIMDSVREVYLNCRVIPHYMDHEISGLIVQLEDITEQMRAQHELEISEHYLTEAQRMAQMGNWERDIGKHTTRWSDELYRIYGREKVSGIPDDEDWFSRIHPEDRAHVETQIASAMKTGAYEAEFRFYRYKDSELRYIQAQGVVNFNANREPQLFIGIAQDVTSRVKAEQQIRASEMKHRNIFESLTDIYYRTNAEGMIIDISPSVEKILGYTPEEVTGSPASDFYANPSHRKLLLESLEQKGVMENFETVLLHKKGHRVYVSTNTEFIKDADGNPVGVHGMIRNITEKRRAQGNLIKAQHNLKEAQRIARLGSMEFEADTGKILYWSEGLSGIFNVSRREHPETAIELKDYVHPEDVENIEAFLDPEKEVPDHTIEFRFETEETRYNWIRAWRKIGRSSRLAKTVMVVSFQDITDQKKTEKKIRDVNARISTMYNTEKAILNSESVQEVCEIVLGIICKEMLDFERASVALFDSEDGVARFVHVHFDGNSDINTNTEIPLDSFSNMSTLQSGMYYYAKDLRASERLSESDRTLLSEGIVSYIVFPLMVEGRLIGSLNFGSMKPCDFRFSIVELVEEFSNQVAIAINKHMLLDRLEASYDQLKEEHKNAMKYHSRLLSSQINPHFMFNALNSIQYYILDSNPEPALDFLTTFARLVRLSLQNSEHDYISLSEELEFLGLYIDLEKSRFNDSFEFTVDIHDDIDPDDVYLPPMLLQPYIENSIVHGFGYKEELGLLELKFFPGESGTMVCEIVDNGIGREKAEEMKKLRTRNTHKSMAMGITATRMELLNKLEEGGMFSARVNDLVDPAGEVMGTSVQIELPDDLGF